MAMKCLALLGILAMAGPAWAQSVETEGDKKVSIAEAKTPSECKVAVQQEQSRLFTEARDTTKHLSIDDALKKVVEANKQCATKFANADLGVLELLALADLYNAAKMKAEQDATIDKAVASAKTDSEKGAAYEAGITAAVATPDGPPSPEAIAKANKLVDQIDQLSVEATKNKIGAHMTMVRAVSLDQAASLAHAEKARALTKELPAADRDPKTAGFLVAQAWGAVATSYAKRGEIEKADAIAAEGVAAFPGFDAAFTSNVKSRLNVYRTINKPAPAILAKDWINAPAGTTEVQTKGAVTMVEFTAFW
jgi:hypothetical protein